MELLNELEKQESISTDVAQAFIKLLAPLAPHLAEELWETSGGSGFVMQQSWPTYDPALIQSDTLTIVVQVNGKVRANIEVAASTSKAQVLEQAKAHENVQKFIEGKEVKKEVYVEGKLVNVVV